MPGPHLTEPSDETTPLKLSHLFPDTSPRRYTDREPLLDGKLWNRDGFIRLLALRLRDASTQSPKNHPPPPEPLTETVRQWLERSLDQLGLPKPAPETIHRISRGLLSGLTGRDPNALADVHWLLNGVLGARRAETIRLPSYPVGVVRDMPVSMSSRYFPSTIVTRADALFLESLAATSSAILKHAGLDPTWRATGLLARLRGEAMESAVTGRPFLVDVERPAELGRSTASEHQAFSTQLSNVYAVLRGLADNAALPGPVFVTDSGSDIEASWHKEPDSSWRWSDEDLWSTSMGSTSKASPPSIDDRRPWTIVNGRQQLDRMAGTLQLEYEPWPGRPVRRTIVRFKALPEVHDDLMRATQDREIRLLEEFCFAHFNGLLTMPDGVHLRNGVVFIGKLPVAHRSGKSWRFDALAIQEAIDSTTQGGRTYPPLDKWPMPHHTDLVLEAAEPERVHVVIQLAGERIGHDAAAALFHKDPSRSVWIQVDAAIKSRIVQGDSLLASLAANTPVKLSIVGHGNVQPGDPPRVLLEQLTPLALADRLRLILDIAGIRQAASRIVLVSCMLETRAVLGSFSKDFLDIAISRNVLAPSGEVTAYAGFVHIPQDGQGRQILRTRHGMPLRHEPDTTLVFSKDKHTGEVLVRDKYPMRDSADVASTSATERATARADLTERLDTLSHGGAVIDRLRPSADAVLVPHWPPTDDGNPKLWFHDERSNSTTSVDITQPSDRRAVESYFHVLGELLDSSSPNTIRTLSTTPTDAHAPDFLNIGLLALALTHLSRGATMSPYQAASMWLGVSQGAVFLAGDVFATVQALRAAMQSTESSVVSGVAAASGVLTKALPVIGTLIQLGMVGLDIKNLVGALESGDSHDVALAGMTLGFDAALLAMNVAFLAAPTWAPVVGGPLVLLAGLAVGVTGLAGAIVSEIHRLEYNLKPLHEIDKALDSPLHIATGEVPHGPVQTAEILWPSDQERLPMSIGKKRFPQPLAFDEHDLPVPTGPAPSYLSVSPWASVDRIDFVAGELGFARSTIGESSVHRSGLTRMYGNLHDWHILDGSDHQRTVSFTGKNLDLWDMLHVAGRATTPTLALTAEQRSADRILILSTSPALDIDFEAYSNSRAGGDLSLLNDPLLDRIERNSNLDFVGDYVSSSSMAKSADVWRYAYRPTTFSVVLDHQTRMLALPGRNDLESASFTFVNHDGERNREIRPMDQSLVDYRLVGGGGHCSLALPADGTRRGTVLIEPSGKPGESWTISLDGALGSGGKPLRFLDPPEHGMVAFELNGQQIRCKVPPAGSPLLIAVIDPSQPKLAVLLDPARRTASLSVDIGSAVDAIDPLSNARRLIGQLFVKPAPGSLAAAIQSPEAGGFVLIQARSSTDSGASLSGHMDLAQGRVVLRRDRELWLRGTSPSNAEAGNTPWIQHTIPAGALTMNAAGDPVLTLPGNTHVESVRFTWDWSSRRFERAPLALTERGDAWVRHWLSTAGDWRSDQLLAAMSASEVTQGLDLSGPSQVPLGLDAFTFTRTASLRFDSEKDPAPHWRQAVGVTPYRSLALDREGFSVVAESGDRFEVSDTILSIVLNGASASGEPPPTFKMLDQPLLREAIFSTPIRRVQIQGNARPLDPASLLVGADLEEVVILPEADLVERHLKFEAGWTPTFAYDGLDLLIFDGRSNLAAPVVVRVRDAMSVGDAASGHALIPDPRLHIEFGGVAPTLPSADRQLVAPLLTLPGRGMTLTRDGGDLVVRSADGWDEQRLDKFFDPDAPTAYGEGSPADLALLLRLPDKDGSLRVGPLRNGRLLEMMWEQLREGTPVRWTGGFGAEESEQVRVKRFEIGQSTPAVGSASFTLKAAMLSELIAGSPATKLPSGQDSLHLPPREFTPSPLTAPH
ncbi:C80 family cysteine peptidase [Roseateles sp.]|uniref:C80 family cysteine peptidase n=1 Tax=Roseateles sp. TaxID=1971397 RepID=UPI0031D2EE29